MEKITGMNNEIRELRVDKAVPATSMDFANAKKLDIKMPPINPPNKNVESEYCD